MPVVFVGGADAVDKPAPFGGGGQTTSSLPFCCWLPSRRQLRFLSAAQRRARLVWRTATKKNQIAVAAADNASGQRQKGCLFGRVFLASADALASASAANCAPIQIIDECNQQANCAAYTTLAALCVCD